MNTLEPNISIPPTQTAENLPNKKKTVFRISFTKELLGLLLIISIFLLYFLAKNLTWRQTANNQKGGEFANISVGSKTLDSLAVEVNRTYLPEKGIQFAIKPNYNPTLTWLAEDGNVTKIGIGDGGNADYKGVYYLGTSDVPKEALNDFRIEGSLVSKLFNSIEKHLLSIGFTENSKNSSGPEEASTIVSGWDYMKAYESEDEICKIKIYDAGHSFPEIKEPFRIECATKKDLGRNREIQLPFSKALMQKFGELDINYGLNLMSSRNNFGTATQIKIGPATCLFVRTSVEEKNWEAIGCFQEPPSCSTIEPYADLLSPDYTACYQGDNLVDVNTRLLIP